MFDALVFAVLACRFVPRSALEISDSGKPRIDIIKTLIGDCRLSIHDISRVKLNDNGLPRFNMPLELGLWIGAEEFGDERQKRKKCLILESERFRYQQFISDIGGQDTAAHNGQPDTAIAHVRNFLLAAQSKRKPRPPCGAILAAQFHHFQAELPAVCEDAGVDSGDLPFNDRSA